MKFNPKTISVLAGTLALWCFSSFALSAQTDAASLVDKSLELMKVQKWEEAAQMLTQVTAIPNAKLTYGARLGVIWYRKGICHAKMGQHEEAIKCYKTCFDEYPPDDKGGGNFYHKLSLLKRASSHQALEQFNEAITYYKKFIELRSKERGKDEYSYAEYYLNLSICYFKLFKLPEGVENLEIAIKNRDKFRTPDNGIATSFQAFVGACIEKKNEQQILDFISKNRADITIEPFEMAALNQLFLKTAYDTYSAEMQRAAIAIYQMVSHTEISLEDLSARLESLASRAGVEDISRIIDAKVLKASVEGLKKQTQESKFPEATQLLTLAFVHETNGNPRAAYAAYEIIEQMYDKHKNREDNLYQLIRTSSVIGEVMTTEKYGQIFLKTYPESKHVKSVQNMMLNSLFYEGEYKKCIEVANVMKDTVEKGSEQHDICIHVLGGSYYYEGQYDLAMPFLDQHVNEFKQSKSRIASLFFQSSNIVKLQDFQKGAVLLDAFLKEYPDPDKNSFLPFALFDRANCHFAESEYKPAGEILARIENEFPATEVLQDVYNLKGNVLLAEKDLAGAETYYKKGLETAKTRGIQITAGQSVYLLIAMLGDKANFKDNEAKIKDAVPWIDMFWKEYATGSPFRIEASVAGIYALDAVDRGQEGLDRIRDVILELAGDPMARGLEEAINSYTEFYLSKNSAEDLKAHFAKFPIKFKDAVARALLKMAVIGVYESELKKAKDETQKKKLQADVTNLFRELKTEFDIKQLTSFILVRVGDFIREKTGSPREALAYYSEVLARKEAGYQIEALLGRADVLARSTNAADLDGALADLAAVIEKAEEKKQKDKASAKMVEVYVAKADWDKSIEFAKKYLAKENGYTLQRDAISYMLAKSYDKQGKISDAIVSYAAIWTGNYRGTIRLSAPACKRWMELLWERNQPATDKTPADRQGAYDNGYIYIKSTRPIIDGNKIQSEEEKALWLECEEAVKNYEVSPGIISKAKQERDKNK